jgi:hypothetical protein
MMKEKEFERFDYESGTYEVCKSIRDLVYGQSIEKITEKTGNWHDNTEFEITLSNNVVLVVRSNEGCGCCLNGWFEYDKIITCGTSGNVITNISVECDATYEGGSFTIYIYSLDKRLVEAKFTGKDNGYYGIGIVLTAKIKE